MLSRAEMRVRLEHVPRGIVLVVLAVMFWQSLHDQTGSGGELVKARGVGSLAGWSALAKVPSGFHMQLDSVPSTVERAWLAALAGAGSSVTWSGELPPVMIGSQPVASPAPPSVTTASARGGADARLHLRHRAVRLGGLG